MYSFLLHNRRRLNIKLSSNMAPIVRQKRWPVLGLVTQYEYVAARFDIEGRGGRDKYRLGFRSERQDRVFELVEDEVCG